MRATLDPDRPTCRELGEVNSVYNMYVPYRIIAYIENHLWTE